jgi:hypothetical protein
VNKKVKRQLVEIEVLFEEAAVTASKVEQVSNWNPFFLDAFGNYANGTQELAFSLRDLQGFQPFHALWLQWLLPSEGGYLEAEGLEDTRHFSQESIVKEVDVTSARKAFDLSLPGQFAVVY